VNPRLATFTSGLLGAVIGCVIGYSLSTSSPGTRDNSTYEYTERLAERLQHVDSRLEEMETNLQKVNSVIARTASAVAGLTRKLSASDSRRLTNTKMPLGQLSTETHEQEPLTARFRTIISEGGDQLVSEQPVRRPNPEAEADFIADTGLPLGDDAAEILDVFDSSDNIVQLQDAQCRNRICKVSYLPVSDAASGQDPDYLIIDKLSSQLGGKDLRIRFATDEFGAQVMYIQHR